MGTSGQAVVAAERALRLPLHHSRLASQESHELWPGPGGNNGAGDWRCDRQKSCQLWIVAGDTMLKLASLHTKGLADGGLSDPLHACGAVEHLFGEIYHDPPVLRGSRPADSNPMNEVVYASLSMTTSPR